MVLGITLYFTNDYWKTTTKIHSKLLFQMKKTTSQRKWNSKKKISSRKKLNPDYEVTDEIELHEGDVVIYRIKRSGDVWQFRTWIREHQKYVRKSLRTKDTETAIAKAREEYLDINHRLRNHEAVFDIPFHELVEEYLKDQKTRIRIGEVGKGSIGITQGRFTTITTQVKRHLIGFIGKSTKLSTIQGDQFKNKYTQYRRKNNPEVQDVTIINERATIGNVFRFALDKGWIQSKQLPRWEEMSKKNSRKRDAFELKEWQEIYKYLRSWGKEETTKVGKLERELVRCFILILANTGLRLGELRYLKWKNIKLLPEGNQTLVKIDVDVGKTGARESVIGRRGDIFKKVKTISSFKSPEDWVFTGVDTGEQLSKKILYRLWDEIVKNTSLKDKYPKPTFYCLRHTYATFRLYANVPVFDLADNMGCSVKFIEEHYGHIKRIKRAKILTKDFKDEASRFIMEV